MALETEVPVIDSRKVVIEKAIAMVDAEEAKTTTANGEDQIEVEVEKRVEKAEKKEEVKSEPDPEELLALQGKDLMRALQDPVKGRAVAQYLADAFGVNKTPETKAEVKEIKNDILEDLKEGLGEEFSIIEDRLAPA